MPTGQENNRVNAMPTGYAHPSYARALAEYGTPRELPRCGGWILQRPVPNTEAVDAMGCYPLFSCRDWSGLGDDLVDIGRDLVSLTLVTDPFGDYDEEQLHAWFPDHVMRFKEHYVLDLSIPAEQVLRKRAARYARASLKQLDVELCSSPTDFVDDWVRLYQCLTDRHHLTGIHTFSRESFAAQMNVPGFLMFRAAYKRDTVGLLSWYVRGRIAYAHLIGVSPTGYELRAPYALYWSSIHHFRDALEWLDFGGVPGMRTEGGEGLATFKRGWSSGTRPAYFCGRIFDHDAYDAIAKGKAASGVEYFPAYRAGEFH